MATIATGKTTPIRPLVRTFRAQAAANPPQKRRRWLGSVVPSSSVRQKQ